MVRFSKTKLHKQRNFGDIRKRPQSPRSPRRSKKAGTHQRSFSEQGASLQHCCMHLCPNDEEGRNLPSFHFSHLTSAQLGKFLASEKSGDIVLQKFVPPESCSHVRTYRAVWAPYFFDVKAKTSRADPTDSKVSFQHARRHVRSSR